MVSLSLPSALPPPLRLEPRKEGRGKDENTQANSSPNWGLREKERDL